MNIGIRKNQQSVQEYLEMKKKEKETLGQETKKKDQRDQKEQDLIPGSERDKSRLSTMPDSKEQ